MSLAQWLLLALAVVLLFWGVGAYNRLVGLRNAVGGAWLQLATGVDNPTGRAVEPFEVEAGKTLTFELQVPGK